MKTLLATAAALAISSSAMAYQTTDTDMDVQPSGSATMTMHTTLDPTMTLAPPVSWNDQQRALWEQHMSYIPPAWTSDQRTTFQTMMTVPPANWTTDQQALWHDRLAAMPNTWSAQQRAAYEQQVAMYHTPWMASHHSASADRVHEPGNTDPERDARGIAVLSDAAVVPAGFNGVTGTAMGGPLLDPDGEAVANPSYPACTATVTDNCIQLYERGVRASLASWDRSRDAHATDRKGMGGPFEEGNDNTPEDDAIDIDTQPDGSIDVDGDLDGDGGNDIE